MFIVFTVFRKQYILTTIIIFINNTVSVLPSTLQSCKDSVDHFLEVTLPLEDHHLVFLVFFGRLQRKERQNIMNCNKFSERFSSRFGETSLHKNLPFLHERVKSLCLRVKCKETNAEKKQRDFRNLKKKLNIFSLHERAAFPESSTVHSSSEMSLFSDIVYFTLQIVLQQNRLLHYDVRDTTTAN